MVDIITATDLPEQVRAHELVDAMVQGANARAIRVAPCLADVDNEAGRAEAKLILIGAVQRWTEAGAGAFQSATAGPFGMQLDTRQRTGFNLWPSEITALQDICASDSAGAFAVDTIAAASRAHHAEVCSLVFGAGYCSCGANITGGDPLWERP